MSNPETRDNCRTPLDVGVGLQRLQRLSQRGKLPGFRTIDDSTCEAAVHGTLYDRVMTISLAPEGTGSLLTMTTRLKRTLPTVVVIVLVLSIFPGVWLTHSMLETYFGWYPRAFWITCAWYLPLTLLAIPALRAQFLASERAAEEHRKEVAQQIAAAVDGELVSNG